MKYELEIKSEPEKKTGYRRHFPGSIGSWMGALYSGDISFMSVFLIVVNGSIRIMTVA